MRRGGRHDGLAGGGLAGERDAGHVRVRDERGARDLADAVDQVEHAVGQAGLGHDLGQQAGRQRRPLGGLEHHRAARRQGGRELPGLQHERGVPRGDQARHPGRLADHVPELGGRPERVLVQGDGQVGEEPEVLRGPRRLAAGLGDRQPGVERLELGDPRRARLDAVGDPVQDGGPGPPGQARPGPFGERGPGGGHGQAHVARPARRDRGVRAVGHRVRDLERGAVRAGGGRAADEVLELAGQAARGGHGPGSSERCGIVSVVTVSAPHRSGPCWGSGGG